MLRIVSLECWRADGLLYEADGRTDDGKHVHVHYRRPWFSVWLGDEPMESRGPDGRPVINTRGVDVFQSDAHPDVDSGTITRATLQAWTAGEIEWPDRIDGYDNELGDAPGGPGPL